MNLTERIALAGQLSLYMRSDDPGWAQAQQHAGELNPWFTPDFIRNSVDHICHAYLDPDKLSAWAQAESIPPHQPSPQTVGLVMAGNLPLVGFHDWLCTWMSGHHARIKLSGQDRALFEHLAAKLITWDPRMAPFLQLADRLSGSDAYIATGSDNTSRYFEYYFGRYPNLIRKNRTSVALLNGRESPTELAALNQDMFLYFGKGCRNITHLLVPRDYEFIPLLQAGESFQFLSEHHKFKNNYDYQLAICLLNKTFYMTNGFSLFVESTALFSPIGVVQFQFYDRLADAEKWLSDQSQQVQCCVGCGPGTIFGQTQYPSINDYADGVNTVQFLLSLEPAR